jgi:integrase
VADVVAAGGNDVLLPAIVGRVDAVVGGECCRALFNYAARHRHLSPYADNPFAALAIERIPVQNARPITLLTAEQERAFLQACDDWQFPLFLTLILTGLRPGELTHLLLPDDLDLDARLLRVRNKPGLGWQVKTRNERDIPLLPELVEVLRVYLAGRRAGPVFLRRRAGHPWPSSTSTGPAALEGELSRRMAVREADSGRPLTRAERGRLARRLWGELGAVKGDRIRTEFMRLTRAIGLPGLTAPKVLRHVFATALQEGRVDPLKAALGPQVAVAAARARLERHAPKANKLSMKPCAARSPRMA